MRFLLVGTAGHVDHGKTTLVRALTGIDCDRLAEEKRRGITLDLGFAHLPSPDVPLAFVDVPGHERFLHNALAGLGGVRLLLLVVAADEGVKPQTREHLAIAELLEIPRLVVALSRADLATEEALGFAELEVVELLASTRYAAAPILRVSPLTGAGLESLAEVLRREARIAGPPDRDADPPRLPIDRAFHLQGQGVIVTGTLASGSISPGDELELLPAGSAARARSVEVHGERRAAESGERVAIQLAGVELGELRRGFELAAPGSHRRTRRLIVEWRGFADAPIAVDRPTAVKIHLFATETVAAARPLEGVAIAPGERGLVELVLDEPIVATRGDHFIARRPSPEALLGGGRVLDPFGRRQRARDKSGARLARLRGDTEDALVAWSEESGARGLAGSDAAPRLGQTTSAVESRLAVLAGNGRLIALRGKVDERGARYLVPETLAQIRDGALVALRRYFAEHPLARGWKKQEATRFLLPPPARARAELFLDFLVRMKEIEIVDGEVRLPGRSIETPAEHSPLARAIIDRFTAAGLTPASAAELTKDLAPKREIVEGLVRHLVSRGELTRLSSGLIVASSALETLARDVLASDWERFSVPEFKVRFALSRKWAIPLLEHLDNIRVTERVNDHRRVLRTRGSSTR